MKVKDGKMKKSKIVLLIVNNNSNNNNKEKWRGLDNLRIVVIREEKLHMMNLIELEVRQFSSWLMMNFIRMKVRDGKMKN